MNAAEEARSLQVDPIPPVVFAEPLTRVHQLGAEIGRLRELLLDRSKERDLALQYAIDNKVTEDPTFKLNVERSVRKSRTLDVARFREVFPEEYEMACDIERKDLSNRLGHVGEKINLTLVDKLVKKPALEAAQGVVTVKESETLSYSVVRK